MTIKRKITQFSVSCFIGQKQQQKIKNKVFIFYSPILCIFLSLFHFLLFHYFHLFSSLMPSFINYAFILQTVVFLCSDCASSWPSWTCTASSATAKEGKWRKRVMSAQLNKCRLRGCTVFFFLSLSVEFISLHNDCNNRINGKKGQKSSVCRQLRCVWVIN